MDSVRESMRSARLSIHGVLQEESPLPLPSMERRQFEETASLVGEEDFKQYGAAKAVQHYNVEDFITLKIFSIYRGTVFMSRTLWMETGAMALLYWTTFAVLFQFRGKDFGEMVGKESNIRAFIAMFSTLIGLLLSFYTALNLNRWWQMRESLENIMEGSNRLSLMLAHGVTGDEELLTNVQRYSRASVFMIFALARRSADDDAPAAQARDAGYLTIEETRLLEELNPKLPFIQAETLWVWLASVITQLHSASPSLTCGAPHYCALLDAIELGRGGIADIQTYLETPIPFGYVHLLCCLVKLHNIILTFLMVFAAVKLSGHSGQQVDKVGMARTAFRAFFMPFLYNALLILNSAVSNPFDHDFQDFHAAYYDELLKLSSTTLTRAAKKIPSWVTSGRKYQKCPAADHIP